MEDFINYQLRTRVSGEVLCPSCSLALETEEVQGLSTPKMFTEYEANHFPLSQNSKKNLLIFSGIHT